MPRPGRTRITTAARIIDIPMTLIAILTVLIVGALLFVLSPQFQTWRERRLMDKRDAKLKARGITPFPRSRR